MDRAFQKARSVMRKSIRIITGVLVTAGAVALAQQGQQQKGDNSSQGKDQQQKGDSSSQGKGATANEAGSTSGAGESRDNLGTSEKPIMVIAAAANARGTVTDVSKLRRTIKVKTEDGSVVTVKLGKEIKNFDDIKKGDEVNIAYHQETAVALRKTSGPPSARVGHALIAPAKGAPPLAAEVATVESTAVIEGIDQNSRTLKLRAPDGSIRTLHVGDEVQNLGDFQKGDQVAVRATEAIAVEVQKKNT
jgi:hypothetical protein